MPMGGPHPGPEKIEALRSRPGLEQFLKSLQVILTHGRGRETQEDARFGGEAVTSVRPRRPRRRLQRPPGQRRHGDRGPRLCGWTPRAPVQLATDHTCGLWARVGGFPLWSRSQGGASITGREGSGSRPGGRRLSPPPSSGRPLLCGHTLPSTAPSESWDMRTPSEPPASRLQGPTTCYQRPARSVEETVVTRGHQSVAEGHRETPPGPAAWSGAPRGAAPRIQGALVVITVIFSCSRFFFSSR